MLSLSMTITLAENPRYRYPYMCNVSVTFLSDKEDMK